MNISYEFISPKDFFPFFHEIRPKIFESNFDFDVQAVQSEIEKEKQSRMPLMENVQRYQLVVKDGDKIIGWSFGIQRTYQDFYMVNAAVFPEYRRRGIYTELMRRAVEYITDLGFQRIYSRHKMSNNEIIIPKLKFGFVITGFEVGDVFGNLVELSYYTNSKRRELLDIRTGMRKPTSEDLKLIK